MSGRSCCPADTSFTWTLACQPTCARAIGRTATNDNIGRLGIRDVLELLGTLVVLVLVVEILERQLFGRERRQLLFLVGAEHRRECARLRHPVELLAS